MYKVSVVMPVFNVAKYLKHSLDCLVNQTLKDIEIICVDDGSMDNSAEIIEGYVQRDSRVKLMTVKHSFAGGARNAGLEAASGEFIMFLDPDDYYDVTMLETMYNKITEDKTDIVISGVYNVQDGKILYRAPSYNQYVNKFFNNKIFSLDDIKDDIWLFLVYPYNKIYKRDFLIRNNIRFQAIKNTNDASFAFESLIAADKISLLDEAYYYYRFSRPNNTRLTKGSSLNCVIEAYECSYLKCSKYEKFKNVDFGLITILLSSLIWHLMSYCKKYDLSKKFFYDYTKEKLQKYFNNPDINTKLKEFNFLHYTVARIILNKNYFEFTKVFSGKGILKPVLKSTKYTITLCSLPLYRHSYNPCKEKYLILGIPIYEKRIEKSKLRKFSFGLNFHNEDIILPQVKIYLNYLKNRFCANSMVYILNEHIGETFLLSSKLSQLLEKDGINKVHFVLQNDIQKQVLDIFADKELIQSTLMVPTEGQTRKDIVLYLGKKATIDGLTFRVLLPELFWHTEEIKNNHYLDMICKELEIENYPLVINKNITDEDIAMAIDNAKKNGLDIDNFVYVLPESTSVKPIPCEFFEKLIKELKNIGCDIYLNITNERNYILGGKIFNTTLKEAMILADRAKYVVGMRSGLLELFASNNNTPMTVIYNGDNRMLRNSIKKIKGLNNAKLIERDFMCISFNENEVISDILKEVKQN